MDAAWNVADTTLALARTYDKAVPHGDVMKWLRLRLEQEKD